MLFPSTGIQQRATWEGGWSIGARSLGWSPLLTHLLSTRIDLKREAEGRVPTAQIIIKLDAYRESSDGMLWPLRVVCTASNAAALCTAAVARVSEMRKSMVTRRRVCLTAAAARSSSSVKSKNDRPSGIGNPSCFSHKLEAHNEHLVSPPVDLHTEEFRTLGQHRHARHASTTCVDLGCIFRTESSSRSGGGLSDSKVEGLDVLGTPIRALVVTRRIWPLIGKELARVRVGEVLSHENVDVD